MRRIVQSAAQRQQLTASRRLRRRIEAGVPLKRAQEILGHASERTTLAIYTQLNAPHA